MRSCHRMQWADPADAELGGKTELTQVLLKIGRTGRWPAATYNASHRTAAPSPPPALDPPNSTPATSQPTTFTPPAPSPHAHLAALRAPGSDLAVAPPRQAAAPVGGEGHPPAVGARHHAQQLLQGGQLPDAHLTLGRGGAHLAVPASGGGDSRPAQPPCRRPAALPPATPAA